MKLVVFGGGYVGLVTAAGLASCGHSVSVVEADSAKLDLLRRGDAPFHEPLLDEILKPSIEKKFLSFYSIEDESLSSVIANSSVIFIAVGTPELPSGATDLRATLSVVKFLCKQRGSLSKKIVVVKSTVPVGTGDALEVMFRKSRKKPIVISNPEFLKQGNAVTDFIRPERVIVGTNDSHARDVMNALYKPFMLKSNRLIFMDRRSSEAVKYACNAFLATKISFINEMSRFAEACGADIRHIREGMITDSRIGNQFLFPGVGFGGSCFPKDLRSLIHQGQAHGLKFEIPAASWSINKRQRKWPAEQLSKIFGKGLGAKTIAIWGLSFKPNTDDLRESPAGELIESLIRIGAKVVAYDPVAIRNAQVKWRRHLKSKKLSLVVDPYSAAQDADALAILTEWSEFRAPDFDRLRKSMKRRIIVDGRNILDREEVIRTGFRYFGVGQRALV